MRVFFSIIAVLFLPICLRAQSNVIQNQSAPDTILLNNGLVMATHVTDTIGDKVTVEKPNSKKHKKIEIDKEAIFSIRYGSSGKEVVLYIYDTLTGHDYTVDEARLFIKGEQDAQRGFHATGTTIGAFCIGLASGIINGSFIALGPPFLYGGLMSYPRIHVKHKSVSNLEYVKHDSYLYGYDNTARRKRTIKALLWGGVGLFVGYTLNFTGAFSDMLNAIQH